MCVANSLKLLTKFNIYNGQNQIHIILPSIVRVINKVLKKVKMFGDYSIFSVLVYCLGSVYMELIYGYFMNIH